MTDVDKPLSSVITIKSAVIYIELGYHYFHLDLNRGIDGLKEVFF